MNPNPPSYRSSASISRSKIAKADIRSRADAMLQASLTKADLGSSSASVVSPPTSSDPSTHHRSRASITKTSLGSPDLSSLSPQTNFRSPTSTVAGGTSSKTASKLNVIAEKGTNTWHNEENSDTYRLRSVGVSEKHALASAIGADVDESSARLTAAEAKQRLQQMQREMKHANTQKPPRNTAGMFRKACSADILFLIDTTGSMQPYINATRDQIKNIVRDVKATFLHETEVRIAVVSYKDHDCGDRSIQFLDFDSSPDRVSTFLDSLHADGGSDAPEDVLSGIRRAVNASWKLQTRCLIHITDAPPHGGILHDLGRGADTYHEHGSEPHGLTYTPLLKQLVQLKINYALLKITAATDRMLLKFSEIYAGAGADVKLLRENKYSAEFKKLPHSSLWSESSGKVGAEIQFEEMPLGTSFHMLRHLVVRSVTRSASLAATRLVSTDVKDKSFNGLDDKKKLPFNPLTAVKEYDGEESNARSIALEKVLPRWETRSWFKETLRLEGFCPDMAVHGASTLSDMMASDDNIKLSVAQLTVYKRPMAFAAGAIRLASYARTAASDNKFVVKTFKQEEDNGMAQMIEDMQAQALCKAFALEFNSLLEDEYNVDFVVTMGLQDKSKKCLSLEPYIPGTYVKYNSNGGFVKEQDSSDPFNDAAQAFSHFTFERSWGYFLVTDLQGVDHNLTDPAIQTKDESRFKLSSTNVNEEGFKFFFATHECNNVCRKLELESSKEMLASGALKFREHWPTMDSTVCCSNKLCRKIVKFSEAQKTAKYPGCHWCSTCWPQLQSTIVKRFCEEPGSEHAFDVSLFFHESQGQPSPLKCPQHVEKDTTAFTAASTGASLLSRMQSMNLRGTTSGRAW